MRTKRPLKKRVRPTVKIEWLRVVESIEELMEKQASLETPRTKETLFDRGTLDAVNRAYAATSRYYTFLAGGGDNDPMAQKQISQLWQQAGTRMRKYDAALARHLHASQHFWSNEVTWQKDTIQQAWPHLNAIRVCANRMDPELRSPFSMS